MCQVVHFSEKKSNFHNFLGLGSELSMGLAIFAEVACSMLIIVGLFTQLATIPLMITMWVVISIHDWLLFDRHELAPAFLTGYTAILLLGPGKFSFDALVQRGRRR